MENIGKRIKEKRKDKGFSQKDLADKVGVDNSQFSKIETGKLLPTLSQLVELCSILNESMDWIVLGKKNENITSQIDIRLLELLDQKDREIQDLRKKLESITCGSAVAGPVEKLKKK